MPLASGRCSSLVIVSTEDKEIAEVARAQGAEADDRPAELAGDMVSATLTCRELLLRRFTDATRPAWFCLVYPIAVFLEHADLIASSERKDGAEAALGVCEYALHPCKALVEMNGFASALWPEKNMLQSQHFPRSYASNATFCWVRTDVFLETPSLYPKKLRLHAMPRARSVHIDTPDDLEEARRLMAAGAAGTL